MYKWVELSTWGSESIESVAVTTIPFDYDEITRTRIRTARSMNSLLMCVVRVCLLSALDQFHPAVKGLTLFGPVAGDR